MISTSLFLTACLVVQQPLEYRYETPSDLKGFNGKVFSKKMESEGFDDRVLKWKKRLDEGHFCNAEVLDRLCEHYRCSVVIDKTLRADGKGTSSIQIDEVGVGVEASLYERDNAFWKRVQNRLKVLCHRKSVSDAVEGVGLVATEIRKARHFGGQTEVTAYAEIVRRIAGDSKRSECWLLVNFALAPKKLPIYPRTLYHTLMASQGDMALTFIEPHPLADEFHSKLAMAKGVPLEAGRSNPLEQFKMPLPPLPVENLSEREREEQLGFFMINETELGENQIEGIVFRGMNQNPALEGAIDVISRRIPRGSVMKKEDIHPICAEFSRAFRTETDDWDTPIVFRLARYNLGGSTYGKLYVELVELPD